MLKTHITGTTCIVMCAEGSQLRPYSRVLSSIKSWTILWFESIIENKIRRLSEFWCHMCYFHPHLLSLHWSGHWSVLITVSSWKHLVSGSISYFSELGCVFFRILKCYLSYIYELLQIYYTIYYLDKYSTRC